MSQPSHPSITAWREAENRADVASRALRAIVDSGRHPTDEQWEQLKLLRLDATEKLQIMVAEVRGQTQ